MKELLLIFLSVFILFRLFRNQIARFVFGQMVKKFDRAQQRRNGDPARPEGEVTIQANDAPKGNPGQPTGGEYVDYEEIK